MWLLEADLSELERPSAEIAHHLGGCARCQAQHASILTSQKALAAELSDPGVWTAESAVQEARRGRGESKGRRRWAPTLTWNPRGLRARRAWRWVPVPAAAVVALVAYLQLPGEAIPIPEAAFVSEPTGSVEFGVEAADGRMAVFRTENPKIHVVWLY